MSLALQAAHEVFGSSSRAADTYNSADQNLEDCRGTRIMLDVSAVAAGGTLDVKVQVKDRVSGNYVDLPNASFTQKVGTGTDELTIYPGIAASANRAVSSVLSMTWRVVATVAVAAVTFSITAYDIP